MVELLLLMMQTRLAMYEAAKSVVASGLLILGIKPIDRL